MRVHCAAMAVDVLVLFAVQLACLTGAGAAAAALLRWARVPGGTSAAAVVGGIFAGILLGPGVAARALPDLHERLLVGGAEQRINLEKLASRHAAERTALAATGVTPAASEELSARHADEESSARNAHTRAVQSHRTLADWGIVLLLSTALALAAWSARRFPQRHEDWASDAGFILAAFLAVAVAAITTAAIMVWLLNFSMREALAIGGAVAAGSAFAGVPLRWIPPLGRIRAVRGFAVLSMVLAAGLLAAAVPDDRIAWLIVPAAAYGFGTIAAAAIPASPRARRRTHAWLLWVVIPAAAAYATYRVNLDDLVGWQPLLLVTFAALTAGDGHFIGAWLGIQILAPDDQRRLAQQLCVEFAISGLGLTQVAFTVVLIAAAVVNPETPEGAHAIALILANAAMLELTAGINRWGAKRMMTG